MSFKLRHSSQSSLAKILPTNRLGNEAKEKLLKRTYLVSRLHCEIRFCWQAHILYSVLVTSKGEHFVLQPLQFAVDRLANIPTHSASRVSVVAYLGGEVPEIKVVDIFYN